MTLKETKKGDKRTGLNDEDLRTDNWAFSFSYLLNDEAGAATFMRFLKDQKSGHNLKFWFKCRNFKLLYDEKVGEKKLRSAIKSIHKSHVTQKARQRVNLTPEMIKNIDDRMSKEISTLHDLFDPAQKKVYQTLFKNSYSPFLTSKYFLDAVDREKKNKKLKFRRLRECHVFLTRRGFCR